MSDNSQGAALFRAALYDDCLIPLKNDTQEIARLRRLGQIEALKGVISSGAGDSPNTELVKTKILASADLGTILALLELLKTAGKFSDGDLRKLDQLYPHLQIGAAFRAYERRRSVD